MTTSEIDLHGMLDRIAKLEAQNRRWKFVSLSLLLIFASTLTMGVMAQERIAPPLVRAQTVEANTFLLRDSDGIVRGRLVMRAYKPILEFYDESGKVIWSAPTNPKLVPTR
jgi:hypothetical protein